MRRTRRYTTTARARREMSVDNGKRVAILCDDGVYRVPGPATRAYRARAAERTAS